MHKLLVVIAALLAPLVLWAGPVNVNTANAEELSQELVGIGMAKAEAIVEYRDHHGAFETPEELIKVKGIGRRVLAANEGNIKVAE